MSTLSHPDLVNVKIYNVKCVVDEKEIKVTATIPTLQRLVSEGTSHSQQTQTSDRSADSSQWGVIQCGVIQCGVMEEMLCSQALSVHLFFHVKPGHVCTAIGRHRTYRPSLAASRR